MVWSDQNFLLPDGAKLTGFHDDGFDMQVSMPADPDGFFGRQCPGCQQLFRMNGDDYRALPDDLELWCTYCGHHAEHSEFLTEQQLERAKAALADVAVQHIGRMFDDALCGLNRAPRPRSGFLSVEISYRSRPHFPQPLPGISEERLIRIRRCDDCQVRYAIFGEHRFCPVCGGLPPIVVANDALQAETTRLDALAAVPAETGAVLREQGVFTRLWVDTIENLVGIVETLAGNTYRAHVPNAADNLKGKGNIFQRLADMADLFVAAGFDDLRGRVDAAVWARLEQTWAARNVFTHNDGIVDTKYLAKVPGSPAQAGQRLTITESQTRQAIADTTVLCGAVAGLCV